MNAVITIIISMLASLLWTTTGDSGPFDEIALKQLEHARYGLVRQSELTKDADPEDVQENRREVISGIVLFRSRVAELSGKEKELTCGDYERWEKGADEIWKRYNHFLELKREKGYPDEYMAGCFVIGLRVIFRDYFMPKEMWDVYDK